MKRGGEELRTEMDVVEKGEVAATFIGQTANGNVGKASMASSEFPYNLVSFLIGLQRG
jgi:hypothetical protein